MAVKGSPHDVRTLLMAKATEIDAELVELLEQPDDTTAIEFGKRAGDGTATAADRLSRVAAAESLSGTREEITAALAKLDAGTYGICDDCGTAIAPARIEGLPWTSRCVHCAGKAHSQRR